MTNTTKVDTIIEGLRTRIMLGEFGRDGRLPSFRKLVAEYETSQETMNKAMQALQAEGLLLSSGAKGVFVHTPSVHILGYTPDFYSYLKNNSLDAIEEYIERPAIITASNEIIKIMRLPKDSLVLRRFKKQGTKQETYRVVETFYPKKLLTDATLEEMINNVSYMPMEDIKDKFGTIITHIHEEIISRLPTTEEQQLLNIVRTNPIIELKRVCYAKHDNKVYLYTHMILNANHFLLSYNYQVDHWK